MLMKDQEDNISEDLNIIYCTNISKMASLPLVATIHFTLYIIYLYTSFFALSPLFIAIIINALMLSRIIAGFGVKYTCYRVSRGQIFPILMYVAWLYTFPRQEHIYVLPILLSNMGKCYLLFTTPHSLDIDSVESIIILQAKFEIAIIVYVLLRLLILLLTSKNIPYAIMIYTFLLIVFKIKYEIHYGTRKAYEEIHFGLDRIAKVFNLRGAYHLAHRIVGELGSPWNSQKQITY